MEVIFSRDILIHLSSKDRSKPYASVARDASGLRFFTDPDHRKTPIRAIDTQ